MIALTLRQFRAQGLWGLGALAVVGVVLLVTGPHLVHLYDSGVAACRAAGGAGPACNNPVVNADHYVQVALPAVVLVAPALIGMFWGAPLIGRELETGTFRLAWSQSVSRARWLATKLALVGGASALAAAALGLMGSWWAGPIDAVNQNRFSPSAFALHGFVPGGYALFAFALGATAGVIFRRTLPAIAVSLAGFIAARLLVTYDVRAHLLPLATKTLALSPATFGLQFNGTTLSVIPQPPQIPNAWVVSTSLVNSQGHSPTQSFIDRACTAALNATRISPPPGVGGHGSHVPANAGVPAAVQQCLSTVAASYHVVVRYQPAGHFWAMQGLETLLFVVAAALLGSVSFFWIRRRLS